MTYVRFTINLIRKEIGQIKNQFTEKLKITPRKYMEL